MDNFEDNDFDLLIGFEGNDIEDEEDIESRYVKPKKQKILNSKNIKFSNAQQLVEKIDLKKEEGLFAIVDGSFVFGDFILAMLNYHNIKAERMDISTLSMSMHNIAGLQHFMTNGYIDKLNILIGYYFYAHERKKMIKEMYKALDFEDRFQLAVCRNHTKITTILTDRGSKIVIHGSSNLRSSDNMEHLCVSFDDDTYDFITDFNNKIIEKYKTINKPITNKELINL